MATEFGILGELQVTRDGTPCDIGPMRQRSLLARFLLRPGRPIPTERLIEELWPDEAPGPARHRLHVHISRLRSVLGDDRELLMSDDSGYRLRVDPDSIDAARFEALAADGRRVLEEGDAAAADGHFRAALALWRGPALVEFADEPFASSEAARLDQSRLADDLGIEPGPALQAMEQRVLAHDPTLSLEEPAAAGVPAGPQEPPGNLPLQRTTFIGRDRDLSIAGELLATTRLLTLTGAPGSGKTRMALRLAADHGHRYPGGTFLVPLASVLESGQLETTIAATLEAAGALDDSEAGHAAVGASDLGDRLAGRHVLLVLDNLEQVTDAAGPIDRLLDSAPDLCVLATSRAPLGVSGEQEFPVLAMQLPPGDAPPDPSTIGAYDGVELFVARARAADPRFEVTAENAAAIAAIATRLDGLPLALELGAGRLRAFTPQSLLDRLDRRLPLLGSETRGRDDRYHAAGGDRLELRAALGRRTSPLPATRMLRGRVPRGCRRRRRGPAARVHLGRHRVAGRPEPALAPCRRRPCALRDAPDAPRVRARAAGAER